MEIANRCMSTSLVRSAQESDLRAINHLLEKQFYSHIHVDWFAIEDWLEQPGFLVLDNGNIQGSLAATAAPPPAAWVRLAVLRYNRSAKNHLAALLKTAINSLQDQAVTELAWMSNKRWADRWLPELGFTAEHWIQAYTKDDLEIPANIQTADLEIRPVLPEDFSQLVKLEEEAFAPIWRHSYKGLHLAWHQALTFDVAILNGRVVGFQHSILTENKGAHLARMTIHPLAQGMGIGSALLAHTLRGYRNQGCTNATLNTQTDNQASQKLYKRFGFTPLPHKLPVWVHHL